MYVGSPGQICDQLYVLMQTRAIVDVSTQSVVMTVFTAYLHIADINVQGIYTHTHVNTVISYVVAQGYTQIPGIEYTLTYAPMCKYATLRPFLAAAALVQVFIAEMSLRSPRKMLFFMSLKLFLG